MDSLGATTELAHRCWDVAIPAGQPQMGSQGDFCGTAYFVQTPNKWFPVEPHLITPLIHYLPKTVQKRLLRNFTIWGLVTRPTDQQCENFVREVRLLDERELRQLFPDAEIWHERVLGLTKSLIAVRI